MPQMRGISIHAGATGIFTSPLSKKPKGSFLVLFPQEAPKERAESKSAFHEIDMRTDKDTGQIQQLLQAEDL